MAKVRVNVQLEESTKAWCDEQSSNMGMSTSAFINLCISQYKQQMEGLKAMQSLDGLKQMIEELSKNNK
jgi:antitoxin component of RelBE/YafQ-DinJ toxin-antitoxin module